MLEGIINKVLAGEGIPEYWKTGIVVSLYKKGDRNEARNYRSITLLPTAYKIYTEVLRKRLVKEVEEKGILPEGQAGFRKGRSKGGFRYSGEKYFMGYNEEGGYY